MHRNNTEKVQQTQWWKRPETRQSTKIQPIEGSTVQPESEPGKTAEMLQLWRKLQW